MFLFLAVHKLHRKFKEEKATEKKDILLEIMMSGSGPAQIAAP